MITDEKAGLPLNEITIGSAIRVHANYASFKPKGTYIFYMKPSTGGYKNAMIHTGDYGGGNELSGSYSSFSIPKLRQMAGDVKIFAYIPGQGVGVASAKTIYSKE